MSNNGRQSILEFRSWCCGTVTRGLGHIMSFPPMEPCVCVSQKGEVIVAGRCDSAQPWVLLLPPVRTQGFIERASDVRLNTCHSLASRFQSPPFSSLGGCLLIYSLISIWRKLWEWKQQQQPASVQWNIPDNSSLSAGHVRKGCFSKSLQWLWFLSLVWFIWACRCLKFHAVCPVLAIRIFIFHADGGLVLSFPLVCLFFKIDLKYGHNAIARLRGMFKG